MSTPQQLSQHMEDEALAWATRLDGGTLSPAELASFRAWLAVDPAHPWRLAHYEQFYAQLRGTLPAMAEAGVLPPADVPPAAVPRRGWRLVVAGAAVAAGLAAAALLWLRAPLRLETVHGQRESVVLADGSHADLNARTRLAVAMHGDRREVRLEQGEAFFSVTKDPARPFYVITAAGRVRVTGTKFDVRLASGGALEVTVFEGSVEVQPGAADGRNLPVSRPLIAGDQLVFTPATATLQLSRPAAVEDTVAWREGKVVFAGTPLREALEWFAAYHGRPLTAAPDVADLKLGGRYTLDDLDQFARSLEQALPVRVQPQGDGGLRVVAAPARP